jgi:predicted lipoprotein with Yx(FWY)xxD motif
MQTSTNKGHHTTVIRLTHTLSASYRLLLVAPAAGLALLIAACGGYSGGYGAAPSASVSLSASASVGVRSTGLGSILTDAQGRTVYLFSRDSGASSSCDTSCAAVWPPLTTAGAALAGNGASASLVATTTRHDGSKQVTYNGHPLYYYVGDRNPGDTTGQNLDQFGGGWYVVSPAGAQIGD